MTIFVIRMHIKNIGNIESIIIILLISINVFIKNNKRF